MKIDEEKHFCPFSARKTKKGYNITFTNHNALIAELDLRLQKNFLNHPKKMVWKYSSRGLSKFRRLTCRNEKLIQVWKSDETFEKKYADWNKEMDKMFKTCFKRVQIKKNNKQHKHQTTEKLYNIRSSLKRLSKHGKRKREILKKQIMEIDEQILSKIAEKNFKYVKERFEELSKNNNFSLDNFWKIKRKLYKNEPQNRVSVINDDEIEIFGIDAIKRV